MESLKLKGLPMIVERPHPFVENYVSSVLEEVKNERITQIQRQTLSLVLTLIGVLGCLCWQRFSMAHVGKRCGRAFSKCILNPLFPLSKIFIGSVRLMLKKAGLRGKLILDDTDNPRSKRCKVLYKLFLSFDKKTGGYIKLQNLVILLYVTEKLTIPVGFRFFAPDPAWVAWRQEDKRLRKLKVKKQDRPQKPPRNSSYPTRIELALELVQEFQHLYPQAHPQAILMDGAYCPKTLIPGFKKIYRDVPIVTQIRGNQIVKDGRGIQKTAKEYFSKKLLVKDEVHIRNQRKTVYYSSARLFVRALSRHVHVVALRYEGEADARYLISSDLTWRSRDIVQLYAFRWLIEVFNEDWKMYDGWTQMATQRGVDGACRGVILSFLVDHLFLCLPIQQTRLQNHLPAVSAGSVARWLKFHVFFDTLRCVLEETNPHQKLQLLLGKVEVLAMCRDSSKHMASYTLPDLGPSQNSAKIERMKAAA